MFRAGVAQLLTKSQKDQCVLTGPMTTLDHPFCWFKAPNSAALAPGDPASPAAVLHPECGGHGDKYNWKHKLGVNEVPLTNGCIRCSL